jgi:hypothetical protein
MSALRDSHKRLQIEYNNRPIKDADSKKAKNRALKLLENDSVSFSNRQL